MKNKGFTLIELLVVVSIIGVLSTIVLSNLGEARNRARTVSRQAHMAQLAQAVELYHIDNGRYPTDGYDTDVAPNFCSPGLPRHGESWGDINNICLGELISGGYISGFQSYVSSDGYQSLSNTDYRFPLFYNANVQQDSAKLFGDINPSDPDFQNSKLEGSNIPGCDPNRNDSSRFWCLALGR